MKRWYHVAYFADPVLQSALDQIIYVLNPDQKMQAHITLRGPFKSLSTANQNVFNLNDNLIHIVGVGRFPSPQTTVFLQCGSIGIKERWWKPHYRGYHPHVTIYDGSSVDFAASALSILYGARIYTRTFLGPVTVHESSAGQKDFSLELAIDFQNLSAVVGRNVDRRSVRDMLPRHRLECLEKLTAHLKGALNAHPWERLA